MDQLNVQAWIGRQTVSGGQISATEAARIEAALGGSVPPQTGDLLPPLWHWCAFPNAAANERLGPDGHVQGSDLLPPVRLPRRMWAGGALSFHAPLRIGDQLEKRSRVRSVIEKEGKTGPMVLLTVDHQIFGPRGLAIEERQDIVYLEIPDSFTPPAKREMPAAPVAQHDTSGPVLFRYSAVTFNAHRIHYDLPYARDVEHYPGLVVHGPLQATWLMRAATQHQGRPPVFFQFRGVHPMFAETPCEIALQAQDDGLSLWTGQSGYQCMTAHALWDGTQ